MSAMSDLTGTAGVPLVFATPHHRASVFIQFLADVEGFYRDINGQKHSLQPYKPYSLLSLVSPTPLVQSVPAHLPAVFLTSFSGRFYISLHHGLKDMVPGYIPAANSGPSGGNQGDPNFACCYQYIEPTVTGNQINIDMSYIDFTAISLCMTAKNAPHAQNGRQTSESSLKLATATATASVANAAVLPASTDLLPSANFARVISPGLGAPSMYHDFTAYLTGTLASQSVRLAGTFQGVGQPPWSNPALQAQSYDFNATFDRQGNVTLSPNLGSGNGQAPGVPVAKRGQGVGATTKMHVAFAALNVVTGIYGCNPAYSLSTGPSFPGITNDVWGEVLGDLVAGLNFGFVGSTMSFGSTTVGQLASTQWWGNGYMPDGTYVHPSTTPAGNKVYFGGVQATASNYNSYAASLAPLTTGYGFPLGDRLGRNLLAINTGIDPSGYVLIEIDRPSGSSSF